MLQRLAMAVGKPINALVGILFSLAVTAQAVEPSKQPMVAVLPLSTQGTDSVAGTVIAEALSNELLKTGKVRVMERTQVVKILAEQGFQQSGACDGSECAVEVGKLLSIDRLVVGSVGKLGNAFSISLRTVDVRTGEILGSAQQMRRGEIDEIAASVLPGMADELISGRAAADRTATSPSSQSTSPAPAKQSSKGGFLQEHRYLGLVALGVGIGVAAFLSSSEKSSPSSSSATPTAQITARWAD